MSKHKEEKPGLSFTIDLVGSVVVLLSLLLLLAIGNYSYKLFLSLYPESKSKASVQDFQPSAPYYATFFYQWSANAATDGFWSYWQDNNHQPPQNWFANYLPDPDPSTFDPSRELYGSMDDATVYWQLRKLAEARIEVAISSWWGQNHKTDTAFRKMITDVMNRPDNPYPHLRLALYYENESASDPSVDQIVADLQYIRDNYAIYPWYFKIGGKPVIFVYSSDQEGSDATSGAAMAQRWNQAKQQVNFYVVLRVFPSFESNASLADSWHQYAPGNRQEQHGSYSYYVSPGFWKDGEGVRLPRDLSSFRSALSSMVAANTTWKFIQTWNEWGEGTAVEPGDEVIQTTSGTATINPNGAPFKNIYIDALRDILPSLEAGTGYIPVTPTPLPITEVTRLITEVGQSVGVRYDAKDNEGNCLDTIKIIEGEGNYRYLGVYHCLSGTTFRTILGSSSDLLNWNFITVLDTQASQPTIQKLSNGGYLVIYESAVNGNHLRFRYYPSISALVSNNYQKQYDAARTLSPRCSEGTPNVYSVSLSSDIDHSDIEIGFHFHYYNGNSCTVDKIARGNLVNFSSWSAHEETGMNQGLLSLGINGNMGDRDYFTLRGKQYNIQGGQLVSGDFGSWRSYLYDFSSGSFNLLAMRTNGSSSAFANPTVTVLTLPNDVPGLVSTAFIPSEAAAPGEAGQLLYYQQLPTSSSPTVSPVPTAPPSPTTSLPTPSNTPTPTLIQLPTSTPFPSSTPIPTPTPSPTLPPSPTPTLVRIPCLISAAAWGNHTSTVLQGTNVILSVTGVGDCDGREVSFSVKESDAVFEGGNDESARVQPSNAFFVGNTAQTTWITEWSNDCAGFCLPPEYFFTATIAGQGIGERSANPLLQVVFPPTPTPIPSPTPTLTPVPTNTPVPTPTATPTPSPTRTPTPVPTATPTPTPIPCSIVSASWSTTSATEGQLVSLTVTGSENCNSKIISFAVREDDSILEGIGDEPARENPTPVVFSGTSARASWVAEWQNDCLGLCLPPEYFFTATIVGEGTSTVRSSSPLLHVVQLVQPPPTPTPTPTRTPSPTPSMAVRCTSSLQAKIDAASAGTTVYGDPCIYRETVTIDKPLIVDGRGIAQIRGSNVWTSWVQNGNLWMSTDTVPSFYAHGECRPSSNGRCLWPEQVFIDGNPLYQVSSTAIPTTGQFKVDSSRKIVLADNPVGHLVEVTTRNKWIHVSSANVTIQNFIMKHSSNDSQTGALTNGDGNAYYSTLVVQNNVLSHTHGGVVDVSRGSGHRIINNDIGFGGQKGIGGNQNSGTLVQGNKIHDNNTEQFDPAWEAGGVKFAYLVTNLTYNNNEVYQNDGPGLWCDINCRDIIISNNRVYQNRESVPIFFEISDGTKIFGNKVFQNTNSIGWGFSTGILVSSSKNAEVYNNISAWNKREITVLSQDRGNSDWNSVTGNYVHDNFMFMNNLDESYGFLQDWTGVIYDTASNNKGANNAYWYPAPEGNRWRFNWNSGISKLSDFNATPAEENGRYLSNAEKDQILEDACMPKNPTDPNPCPPQSSIPTPISSPTPTVVPTSTPVPTVTPELSATPIPTQVPTVTPTPSTPTPTPVPCSLISATWNKVTAVENEVVLLSATATGTCSEKQVTFEIRRNVSFLPDESIQTLTTTFTSTTVQISWNALWRNVCLVGSCNPQYFFNATVVGEGTPSVRSNNPLLTVMQVVQPNPTITPTLVPTNTPIRPSPTPTRGPTLTATSIPMPTKAAQPSRLPTTSPTKQQTTAPTITSIPISIPPFASIPCEITVASWNNPSAAEQQAMTLSAVGFGDCDRKTVRFEVRRHVFLLPDESIAILEATFSNTSAQATWTALWKNACFFIACNPEYYFIAAVVDEKTPTVRSVNPRLTVAKQE